LLKSGELGLFEDFNVQEELKKLPVLPGVYLFISSQEEVIYVGKAINLRSRVRSYFNASNADIPKIIGIRTSMRRFEYIVTDTEIEALILECNLIKKHMPRYNVLLKDDKSYPYIKITINEDFPRVFSTRNTEPDGGKYLGPYTSSFAVAETIEVIHKIWPLKTCNKRVNRGQPAQRVCLNHHIGLCPGCCGGFISQEDYLARIADVMSFLGGKDADIRRKLQVEMEEASENLLFEKAADLRDKIAAIKRLNEKQKAAGISTGDQDIIAFASHDDEALFQVFFIRDGKMTGREHFMVYGVENARASDIMTQFVTQFYSGTPFVPKELILQYPVNNPETITAWLAQEKEQKVALHVPQKGEKLKLVKLAHNNAIIQMEQFGDLIKKEQQRTTGALEEIQAALGMEIMPARIESYDISNIQGFENVGSMVVFEDGKPKRNDYRKFKIKTVVGANDFASMQEVLTRRFRRYEAEQAEGVDEGKAKFSKLPDLLLIDGGKPQISAAMSVLDALRLDIPICGMVKDHRHRTRGLLYYGEEILLPAASQGFRLITRIQEETHRFAIEYHRSLRSKAQTRSTLDDIKGIGKTRKQALMRHFKTINNIKQATIEELAAVDGMNKKAAAAIHDFFANS